jgi:hypothetical protein
MCLTQPLRALFLQVQGLRAAAADGGQPPLQLGNWHGSL